MVHIAICEAKDEITERLSSMLNIAAKEIGVMIESTVFSDTETLCRQIEIGAGFDIYIIDKDFKDPYCDNIIKYIRNYREQDNAQIVIIVDKTENDFSIFKHDIMSYIVKPISQNDITKALEWYSRVYYNPQKTFSISHRKAKRYFDLSKIIYFESENRTVKLYTKNHVYKYYGNLKDVLDRKERPYLVRIHQSYVINTFYVEEYSPEFVTLIDGVIVPVSKRYRNTIMEIIRAGGMSLQVNYK